MIRRLSSILLILTIPLALPASGTEPASLWDQTGLFHDPVNNKQCSAIPAGKLNKVPGYGATRQTTDDCDYFYPSHTSLAMHIFYIEWVNKFRDDDEALLKALNSLEIEYGTYQRRISRVFSIDGTYRPNPTTINGLTGRHGKYVFVWIGAGAHPRLYKTSFVHELIHVAIYASNFGAHGDPDHEGTEYPGWTTMHTKFISDTNKILKSMDL